eukprot:9330489-Pyramimonas_sp.AAC.1
MADMAMLASLGGANNSTSDGSSSDYSSSDDDFDPEAGQVGLNSTTVELTVTTLSNRLPTLERIQFSHQLLTLFVLEVMLYIPQRPGFDPHRSCSYFREFSTPTQGVDEEAMSVLRGMDFEKAFTRLNIQFNAAFDNMPPVPRPLPNEYKFIT